MGLDWALIVTSNGETSSSTLSRSRPQVSQRTLLWFTFRVWGGGACHLVLLLLLCSSSCVDYATDGLIKIHLFSPSTGMTQCVNTRREEEDASIHVFIGFATRSAAQWDKQRSTLTQFVLQSFPAVWYHCALRYLCLEVAQCSEAGAAQRLRHRWLFSIHQLLAGNL